MGLNDLIPRVRKSMIAHPHLAEGELVPFGEGDALLGLHREFSRLFDDLARNFTSPTYVRHRGGWPSVDIKETDKTIEVTAEMPGLEEKDVEVSLHEDVLTLKGEKKVEGGDAVYSERWRGRFERVLRVGPEVDPEKVTATFKNGVLTVTLGKRPEAQSPVRRIPINIG